METAFLPDLDKKDDFRIQLADYFEGLPPSTRSCDELPWLLWQTESFERLRNCLLDIDSFLEVFDRDQDELKDYWVYLNGERSMGKHYLASFNVWFANNRTNNDRTSYAANRLGPFLHNAALHSDAEYFHRLSLQIDENSFGKNHPDVASRLNNLAQLLQATNRIGKAEPIMRRAVQILVIFTSTTGISIRDCKNI